MTFKAASTSGRAGTEVCIDYSLVPTLNCLQLFWTIAQEVTIEKRLDLRELDLFTAYLQGRARAARAG